MTLAEGIAELLWSGLILRYFSAGQSVQSSCDGGRRLLHDSTANARASGVLRSRGNAKPSLGGRHKSGFIVL